MKMKFMFRQYLLGFDGKRCTLKHAGADKFNRFRENCSNTGWVQNGVVRRSVSEFLFVLMIGSKWKHFDSVPPPKSKNQIHSMLICHWDVIFEKKSIFIKLLRLLTANIVYFIWIVRKIKRCDELNIVAHDNSMFIDLYKKVSNKIVLIGDCWLPIGPLEACACA